MNDYGLDWKKMKGLMPVVMEDSETNETLMLAYASPEALQQTVETGIATFYSRSKKRLWTKGETSGNTMEVTDIFHDCDDDALIYRVKPNGPACHTGKRSCFYRRLKMRGEK